MAGDTTITFYGLWHLAGTSVTVSIAGLDCGQFTVAANGSVVVPYGSDAGGLLTPNYLIFTASNTYVGVENNVTFNVFSGTSTVSVTVPVVIGLTYTTQAQLLRPDLAADIRSPLGPGLGKTRRVHMVATLIQDAVHVSYGTDFSSTLLPATFTTAGETTLAEDVPFSGVYWTMIESGYNFEGQVCWQVNRPYALTVSSVSIWASVAER